MSTPQRQNKIPSVKKVVTTNPTIPNCKSSQLFFASKHKLKKKKTFQKNQISNQVLSSISKPTLYVNHANMMNTNSTTESSFETTHISFKKKQPKSIFERQINQKKHKQEKNTHQDPEEFQTKKKVWLKVQKSRKILLQDFIIVKKVGEGSYSQVFLAYQKNIGLLCVLKILDKKSIIQNQLLNPIIRQLKAHHYINHQNIIGFYGFFDDAQKIYLICQYANEGDLYHYVKNKRRSAQQIQLQFISLVTKQLCEAVLSMHTDYLMHRDIKPQNIFLCFGNVKLGDFGWSVYNMNKALRNTQCGTPLYLAPQQVEQTSYSQAIDVWAIGVLTFELLTGQLPFQIFNERDMKKVCSQQIFFDMIQDDRARDFVQKMLQRDVRQRVQIQDVIDHPFLNLDQPQQDIENFII